ncbi:MAG: hypothetical protein HQK89_00935 [Nitrospirae bacterium]|nr:hypothetical protein [Nitrospirota bacterium]
MLEELNLLREMQSLDTEIIKLKTLIEKAPLKAIEGDASYKEASSVYEQKKSELAAIFKQKKELEMAAEEKSDRVKKLRTRSSDIKTNKEYQSHLKEIEQAEKDFRLIEDDILAIMEKTEAIEKTLAKNGVQFKQEQERLTAKKAVVKKELEDAGKELEFLLGKRQKLVRTITGKDMGTYERYMALLEKKNGLAVVKAEKDVCMGCNMSMPPQLFVEVTKSEKLVTCPQCGRIMYYAEEANGDENN